MAGHVRLGRKIRNSGQSVHRYGGGRRSRTAVSIGDGHHIDIHAMGGRCGDGISHGATQTIGGSPAELIRCSAILISGRQQHTLALANRSVALMQSNLRHGRHCEVDGIRSVVTAGVGQRHGHIHIGIHIRAGSHRLRDGQVSRCCAVVVRLTISNRHEVRNHKMTVIRNQHRIGDDFCQIRTRRIQDMDSLVDGG